MIENGILNINKPQGMTSHDVIYKVRRALGIKRVGHTGTLDPMATGVLPVCVGKTTRITEYLDLDFKTYRCTLLLGQITDTQDIWGTVLEERPTDGVTENAIECALSKFNGLIEQKPPMYSAIKVNGKKLYEYARAGQEVEVKTRKIYIENLTIENINLSEKTVTFLVKCSKGTYIRTICQDVGMELGCGATMASLVRTASGRFVIEEAIDLVKLQEMNLEEIQKIMLPTDFPLVHFGQVSVDTATAKKFIDGHHLPLDLCKIEREPEFKDTEPKIDIRPEYKKAYNVYQRGKAGNVFIGIAFYNEKYKKLVADKVLSRGESIENI